MHFIKNYDARILRNHAPDIFLLLLLLKIGKKKGGGNVLQMSELCTHKDIWILLTWLNERANMHILTHTTLAIINIVKFIFHQKIKWELFFAGWISERGQLSIKISLVNSNTSEGEALTFAALLCWSQYFSPMFFF